MQHLSSSLSFFPLFTEVVSAEECAQLLRHIASTPSLPPQYWLAIHCLIRHFSRVCQNCTKNLLSARAVGEIFSPMVFRQQSARWVPEHASLRRPDSRQQTDALQARSRNMQTFKRAHLQTHLDSLIHTAASGSHVAFSCTHI